LSILLLITEKLLKIYNLKYFFNFPINIMKIVTDKVNLAELKELAASMLGNLVKAVVDIKKEIIAVDAELHSDEEALLLKEGSNQEDIWE